MQNENQIESALVSFRGNRGSNDAWDVLKIFVCLCVFFVCLFFCNSVQNKCKPVQTLSFFPFPKLSGTRCAKKGSPNNLLCRDCKMQKGVGSKLLWIRKKMTSLHGFLLEGAGTGNARISGLKLE